MPPVPNPELRILVLSPLPRDLSMAAKVLAGAGFQSAGFSEAAEMAASLRRDGAGMLIIAVEALYTRAAVRELMNILHEQPAWSDLPVTILTSSRISTPVELEAVRGLEHLHSVTFLDRPVRIAAMVSTVRAGLQARRRQYQVRDLLKVAEDDIRQRDEFLAMLSHELRNPLSAIKNAAQVINLRPEAGALVAPTLDRQVGQLSRMVNDLLDVARITNGKVELRRRDTDLTEIMRGAVEAVDGLIREKRHHLDLDLPLHPIIIFADPARLMQVCSNLLHNAAKYTESGGRIAVNISEYQGRAEICVADNGVGLDADSMERIFDLFAQGDREIDRSQGGLGIGLTIVRRLVQMHDGEVRVESDGPGQGCRFFVSLPLSVVDQPSANLPTCERGEQARRVLVVDDDKEVARTMALLLEILGHEIRVVNEPEKALAQAREFRPEVVLLDLGMPGMNGFEVARALRTLPNSQEMTVVAVTGYGGEKIVQESREAGFDHHLLKPVEINSLQEVFRNTEPARLANGTY